MKKRKLMALFLCLSFILTFCSSFASELSESGQELRANELKVLITRTPASEVSAREKLYLALIRECPDTEAAQEAFWSLSNLYTDDYPEPREDSAGEILELFLKQYPDSVWCPHVKNRLIRLYGNTDKYARIADLCEDLLAAGALGGQRLSLAWTCAEAAFNAKDADKSKKWYKLIINDYPQSEEAAKAQKRLASFSKKK